MSLIESENIDYYNSKYRLDIPYLDFRRNIITQGIRLNDLIGKKIQIGQVLLEGIDLCRPCKHLTEILNQDNIIKEFLRRGGLRCQILSSSKKLLLLKTLSKRTLKIFVSSEMKRSMASIGWLKKTP